MAKSGTLCAIRSESAKIIKRQRQRKDVVVSGTGNGDVVVCYRWLCSECTHIIVPIAPSIIMILFASSPWRYAKMSVSPAKKEATKGLRTHK